MKNINKTSYLKDPSFIHRVDYKGIVSELWNTTIYEGNKDEEPVNIYIYYIYIFKNSLAMLMD